MAKEKNPGGRPKGSGKGKRGKADPANPKRTKVKACPDLAKPTHDASCTICGGSGEYTP